MPEFLGQAGKPHGFAGEIYQIVPPEVRDDLYTYPLTHELAVTDLGRYPRAYRHFYRREHGAREHILIVCDSGRGFCRVHEAELWLKPYQFVLIPAGTPHEYGACDADPWSISWCHLVGVHGDILAQQLPLTKAPFDIAPVAMAETSQLFELIFDVMKRGFSTEHLTVASSLIQAVLAVLLFDNAGVVNEAGKAKNRYVEKAVEFINRDMDKPISVEDIARAAGLSASRLTQLFREYVGRSPKRYLTRERMLRACHYLDATDVSIAQIADLVGYPDPLHFSRVFRRVLHRSPRQYRARTRGQREERS